MSDSGLRHGAVYVRTLAEYLLSQNYSSSQVFDGTGFDPSLLEDENPFADFSDIAGFFEHAAELTNNDTLGFERGELREMRRVGLLCYVGLSSPTVSDFLGNIARYRRVFSDAVDIDASSLNDDGTLTWVFRVSSTTGRRQYVEFGASGILACLRQATQRKIELKHARFHHARHTNIDVVQSFLGCPVQFGASVNAFVFDPADLALPLATADDHLYSVLTEFAEEVLQRTAQTAPPIIVQVERAIADMLVSGEANQNGVARALAMSPRTLARRLADGGTTFFTLLDGLRQSLALGYLRDGSLSMREIAFLLGYSNLGGFHDAFKRWTGTTPGKYRSVSDG